MSFRPQKITIIIRACRSPWTEVFVLPMLKVLQTDEVEVGFQLFSLRGVGVLG